MTSENLEKAKAGAKKGVADFREVCDLSKGGYRRWYRKGQGKFWAK